MNISIGSHARDLAKHRTILQRSLPEVTIIGPAVLLPVTNVELVGLVYEVWWPIRWNDNVTLQWMHVSPEGVISYIDEIRVEDYDDYEEK